jgi:hypothetical protein
MEIKRNGSQPSMHDHRWHPVNGPDIAHSVSASAQRNF